MAEGIFNHLLAEKGLSGQFEVDSAGTSAYHEGEPCHPETSHVLKIHGIDYSGKSRPVETADFSRFDRIIAMDSSNFADLNRACTEPSQRRKISHMLEYSQSDHIVGLDVPDPYRMGRAGFERVYELLLDACQGLLIDLQKKKRE
jgi:protein-tyrosine phosphatase